MKFYSTVKKYIKPGFIPGLPSVHTQMGAPICNISFVAQPNDRPAKLTVMRWQAVPRSTLKIQPLSPILKRLIALFKQAILHICQRRLLHFFLFTSASIKLSSLKWLTFSGSA